ncbi:hypothetical protein AB0F91_14935 [Amycolatopsis sp. NPDC023774]|uniref:hypothetical protein n=1 Tax=Amycolatopsis sp. NPDC023774 TaxID=3155015 RepID=UPI0033D9944F
MQLGLAVEAFARAARRRTHEAAGVVVELRVVYPMRPIPLSARGTRRSRTPPTPRTARCRWEISPERPAALAVAVAGLGVGLCVTPTDVAGLAGAPSECTGIASATVNATRQTGTARDVAALGALVADGSNRTAGLHAATAVAGGVLLVVTVLTVTTLRGA